MSNGISLKGIVAPNGTVHHFDHEYLENNPPIPEIDTGLDTSGEAADSLATGNAISALGEDLDVAQKFIYTDSSVGASSTLNIGKAYRLDQYGLVNNDSCAYSGSVNVSPNRKAGTMTNSAYLFSLVYFTGRASSSTFIRGEGWYEAGKIVPFPAEAVIVYCQVKRVDGAAIQSAETDAIKAAWEFYLPTDKTLSVEWASADAKAVGERLGEIANSITSHHAILPVDMSTAVDLGQKYMELATGIIKNTTVATRMFYIPCVANTVYSFVHPLSSRFVVGCFTDVPAANATPTKYQIASGKTVHSDESTFITDATANYLGVYYYNAQYNEEEITVEDTFEAIEISSSPVDTSLNIAGVPADAKAVGDAIRNVGASNFFKVNDDIQLIKDATEVIAAFDELVTNYPDYVSRNTLISGSITNYEYVFTTGNYNPQTARRRVNPVVQKPIILITTGVHGYERSAVMSMYYFCRCLCENVYALGDIVGAVELRVIPVVCQWGYTNNSRLNANGVNINRNFDSPQWELTPTGDNYSGPSAGSEDETQLVQAWLADHNDAMIYIDWHNSNFLNEISCMAGFQGAGEATEIGSFKKKYLLAISKIVPYWQKERGIGTDNIYAYTGGTEEAEANGYASAKSYGVVQGITSYTVETSWNIISKGKHSPFSIGVGCEVIGNMLVGFKSFFDDWMINVQGG